MRTPSFDVKILVEKVRIILGIYGTSAEGGGKGETLENSSL